jgi:hypothetical protein
LGDQPEDVVVAPGELVDARMRVAGRGRLVNWRATRFVTAGYSSPCPPANMRIAAISGSGGSPLSTKSLAPALNAS